jgi:hypothetical protein
MMAWQLDRLIGQLILLGDHFSDPKCPCSYGYSDPTGTYVSETCIPKHLLAVYEYSAETAPMSSEAKLKEVLLRLAEEARGIRDAEKDKLCGKNTKQVNITEWSRDFRKLLEPYAYDTACAVKDRRRKPARTPAPPSPLVLHITHTPPAPAQPAKSNGVGQSIAEELGVHYDGVQELVGMQFTDPQTGSTTYGNTLEEVRTNLTRMRAKFGKAAPAPGSSPHREVCRYQHFFRQSHVPFLSMPEDPKTGSHKWHRFCISGYDKSLKFMGCPAGMVTETLPVPAPPEGGVSMENKVTAEVVKSGKSSTVLALHGGGHASGDALNSTAILLHGPPAPAPVLSAKVETYADDVLLPVMMEYLGDKLTLVEIAQLLKKDYDDKLTIPALDFLEGSGELVSFPKDEAKEKRWTAVRGGEGYPAPATSTLPICPAAAARKLESCFLKVKARQPKYCKSEWGRDPEMMHPKCANPFAVCRSSVGCRLGVK